MVRWTGRTFQPEITHNSLQAEHVTYDESGASVAGCFFICTGLRASLAVIFKTRYPEDRKNEIHKLFVRGGIDR